MWIESSAASNTIPNFSAIYILSTATHSHELQCAYASLHVIATQLTVVASDLPHSRIWLARALSSALRSARRSASHVAPLFPCQKHSTLKNASPMLGLWLSTMLSTSVCLNPRKVETALHLLPTLEQIWRRRSSSLGQDCRKAEREGSRESMHD